MTWCQPYNIQSKPDFSALLRSSTSSTKYASTTTMLLLSQAPTGPLSAKIPATTRSSSTSPLSPFSKPKPPFFSKTNNASYSFPSRRTTPNLALSKASVTDGDPGTSSSQPALFGGGDDTVFVGDEGVPLEGVIQVDKSENGASSSPVKKWGRVAVLAGGDVLFLLLFAAVGRFSHGFPVLDIDTFRTVDPFLAGWFLSAYFLGGYAEDGRGENGSKNAVVAAAKSWAVGIPLGVAIRTLILGRIPPSSFILVTMGSTGVLLIGWRAMLNTLLPFEQTKGNDVYKRGSLFELFELLASLIRRW